MKRYRVLAFFDFDTRVRALIDPIDDQWKEPVKVQHRQNRENTIAHLRSEFGVEHSDQKIQNFIDLGPKPSSILAFHNAFFAQVRTAFVMEGYYPVLTGACALGERILNHLVLILREDYKLTPQYKNVYRKGSFDDWTVAIETLVAWDVLLPNTAEHFRDLVQIRNKSIHFRPEVDTNARALSLEAIRLLQSIIGEQFSGFGPEPWFISGIPGEIYIKSEWETKPFIRKVYLQNALPVGPRHVIEAMIPSIRISDPDHAAPDRRVKDAEFVRTRLEFRNGARKG